MMLQIYQSARRVIVYLGEQSDYSELMPQFFNTTIRTRRVFESLDNGEENIDREDLNRSVGTMREIGDPTSNNKMWRAARAFYGRPWMFRVWVMQEVVAASELVFLQSAATDIRGDAYKSRKFALPLPSLLHKTAKMPPIRTPLGSISRNRLKG
jgi:hypothetical protein